MWFPLVARKTSRRYSRSCHVLWSMSAGIAEIAFLIRVFRSSSHLFAAKKLPDFHYNLPQTHVASSICLRATIFQNPEGTLWTHCMYKIVFLQMYTLYYLLFNTVYIKNSPTCFELCYISSSGTQLFITPCFETCWTIFNINCIK
jgi:hypothetical protein